MSTSCEAALPGIADTVLGPCHDLRGTRQSRASDKGQLPIGYGPQLLYLCIMYLAFGVQWI